MKKLLLFICFAVILFCAGFKLPDHQGPQDFDREAIKYLKSMGNGGAITGFLGDPALRGNVMQASYWMTAKEVFQGKYFIGNYDDELMEVVLFCLLDYRQVEFKLDNHTGLTHKIRLKKDEEMEVPLKIGHLPRGGHDLIIVAVDISKADPMLSQVHTHRVNVFVESADFPKLTPTGGLSPRKVETDNRVFKIRLEKGLAENQKRVMVRINNVLEEDVTSLVLLFNGFKAIEHDSLLFKLDRKHEVDAPAATVDLKNTCFALKFNNPYTLIEPQPVKYTDKDISVEISNVIFNFLPR